MAWSSDLVKNTIRYISIDQACEKFGLSLCNALPVFHAFTGFDYKVSFKRKGNFTPFKLLEKSTKAREVFTEMGTEISLNNSILERVEKYLCLLCGKKKCSSIDDVRLQIFLEKYKQFGKKGSENETILKIKKLDSSFWPTCSKVLIQKIKRAMFVARRWRCSYMQFQPTSEPCEHGWRLENNKYHIEWFERPACPRVINILDVGEVNLGKSSTNLRL